MRFSRSWMRARVAASGILDVGVADAWVGRVELRWACCWGAGRLGSTAAGGGGVVLAVATLRLHPPPTIHKAVTARPANNLDFKGASCYGTSTEYMVRWLPGIPSARYLCSTGS